ncbi:DNA translocase FtsK 4TM domain-containing protein [Demequina litorisediminis]|uniref:DNA translocase FtsK 4TM region domain-containing protein n=1 Tax=Demequina litorisediminis TaxID=1849022 RepID=A0ABQ6IGV2_9MICO|nr:hypothetical protein GCM10025876_33090 [Demequina litorisediminis]
MVRDAQAWAGTAIHFLVAGAVGIVAILLPIPLTALAIRLFRAPQEEQANHRLTLGAFILVLTVTGLIAIAEGTPSPSGGWDAMRDAGGLLGWIIGNGLANLLSTPLAVIVLILLTLLGVLVVVGMPIRDLVALVRERFGSHHDAQDDTLDLPEHRTLARGPEPKAPKKRRSLLPGRRADDVAEPDLDAYEADHAFDTSVDRAARADAPTAVYDVDGYDDEDAPPTQATEVLTTTTGPVSPYADDEEPPRGRARRRGHRHAGASRAPHHQPGARWAAG